MVAVVERGGFLWFYDFFFGFVAFMYFFLVPEACSMVVHRWLTDGGTWGF